MTKILRHRILPILPIALLVALVSVGIVSTLGASAEDPGPQPADFNFDDGSPDLVGYLLADAAYNTAPNVPINEALDFRALGCTEGSAISVSVVPRVLHEEGEADANDALDDDDPDKLATEPILLVEEGAALAEGSSYEITIPENVPLGFARVRVACTDADGNEVEWDTIVDIVDRAEFEAAQENLGEDEEPAELVTTIDSDPPPPPA